MDSAHTSPLQAVQVALVKPCWFPALVLGASFPLAVPSCASHPEVLLASCWPQAPDCTTGSTAVVLGLQPVVLALREDVSVALELLSCFQSGSQISNSCTTQDCAVETWCFSVNSNQSLISEKNNCSA